MDIRDGESTHLQYMKRGCFGSEEKRSVCREAKERCNQDHAIKASVLFHETAIIIWTYFRFLAGITFKKIAQIAKCLIPSIYIFSWSVWRRKKLPSTSPSLLAWLNPNYILSKISCSSSPNKATQVIKTLDLFHYLSLITSDIVDNSMFNSFALIADYK